jgi:tetratricopeptide (TPR) repeat protein
MTAPLANPKIRPSGRTLPLGLPMVLYALLVAWIVFATYRVAYGNHAFEIQAPVTNQKPTSDSGIEAKLSQQESQIQIAQEKLTLQQDYLEKRATDLERLISGMTLGTTLYSFILGLLAYLSLKAVRTEAEADLAKINGLLEDFKKREFEDFKKNLQARTQEEIDRAREEFEGFKTEVRNDIPAMYGIERSLGVILDRILRQVDMSRNWTLIESYEAMTDEERQTVLIAEMTVAGFDYFRFPESKRYRRAAAQVYIGLASFYAARSRITDVGGLFNQVDMRRAFIYIDRACATDPRSPRAFSQRAAFLLIDVPKKGALLPKEHLDKAESDLNTCLSLGESDARALYNLAWVTRRRGNLPKAIALLTKILDARQTLAPEDRGHRVIDAFTNRACYRALVLSPIPADAPNLPQYQTEASSILADCQAACEEAKVYKLQDYCREGFAREFSSTGDLNPIRPLVPDADVSNVVSCA